MTWALRIRLSAMMFIQYAIWGLWAPILAEYLGSTLHFRNLEAGWIFNTISIGAIISPFIAGQIADRYFATEKFLAITHLGSGAALLLLSGQESFTPYFVLMLLHATLYGPTLALTNSIALHHLPDPDRQFSGIRLWGTIGWIIAGLVFGLMLKWVPGLHIGHSILAAGLLSLAMGLLCWSLPHTPPSRNPENPWAFLGALKLMKDPSFLVLVLVSFVVTTEFGFYYLLTPRFLGQDTGLNVEDSYIGPIMTIGQVMEILALAILPLAIKHLGMRNVIALGILAWPVRYGIFAIGQPLGLIIAAQSLHGFAYAFFFVATMIYVDRVAGKDIRASAQSLVTFVTIGVGMGVGYLFAGAMADYFTDASGVIHFTSVFLVPVVVTMLCAVLLLAFFRERTDGVPEATTAAAHERADRSVEPAPPT